MSLKFVVKQAELGVSLDPALTFSLSHRVAAASSVHSEDHLRYPGWSGVDYKG